MITVVPAPMAARIEGLVVVNLRMRDGWFGCRVEVDVEVEVKASAESRKCGIGRTLLPSDSR